MIIEAVWFSSYVNPSLRLFSSFLVYSIFSFFEYVAIVINVYYHYTVYRIIEHRPLYTMLDYWTAGTDFSELESLD